MKMKIIISLIALLFFSEAFTQSSKLSLQSSLIEKTMFENKKNGLGEFENLQIQYLIKLEGVSQYGKDGVDPLSIKLETIPQFISVIIDKNNMESIMILATGDCQPEQMETLLRDQGFKVLDYSGEIQLK